MKYLGRHSKTRNESLIYLIYDAIWDARDIECDYDTDSDDEDGLEYDEDDFDCKWLQDIKLKFFLY